MYFQILLIGIGLGLLAWLMYLHGGLARAARQSTTSKPLSRYPSVTVVRPIKGLDTGIKENIEAALDHGYPGEVETLFVFDDEREPVLPLVRWAIETHGKTGREVNARILFSGEPPPGRTGKLNAMITGFQESRGELVAFADSDIRPDRDTLRMLVETLCATPHTGAASAPVVVTEAPATLGDTGYALMLNGLYAPVAAKTVRRLNGNLSFIMGQFMVLTREAIAAIGGFESATGQLVDDMYLGARIKAAGYRNVVSPHAVPIIQSGMSLKDFWRTYVRWIAFSRTGLPGREFKVLTWLRPAIFFVGLIAAGIALSQGFWSIALLNALAPVGVTASTNHLHRIVGGGRLTWDKQLASFLLLLVGPAVLLSTVLQREVNWRGRSYKLNGKAQLAAGRALAPDEACVDCRRAA
jgi:ceramide glucosyltransferase